MLVDRPSAVLVAVYCVSRGLSVCVPVTVNPCACALAPASNAHTSPSSIPRRSISFLPTSNVSHRQCATKVPTVPPGTVARHEYDCRRSRSRAPRRPPRALAASVPAVALALVVAGAFAVFLAFPTYPAYDSLYSLLWAQRGPGTGSCPASTPTARRPQHPLLLPVGLVLAPFGDAGARAFVALCLAGMVALLVAMYRLGRLVAGVPGGLVAAGLLLTRFNFGLLASKGYLDIPYCALVTWAMVLEAERPRRGGAVWWLLGLAGLLRPEAWLLAGRLRPLARPRRAGGAAAGAAARVRGAGDLGRDSTSPSPAIRCSRSITPTRWPRSSSARSRTQSLPRMSLVAADGDPEGAAAGARGDRDRARRARPAAGAGGARRGGGRDAGDLLRDRHAAGWRRSTATCCRPGSGCWPSPPTR